MPLLYLCIGCGFAASRAESLRLSVKLTILLAATPPEAKPPLFQLSSGKPEAFRTGSGKAATNYREGAAANNYLAMQKRFAKQRSAKISLSPSSRFLRLHTQP